MFFLGLTLGRAKRMDTKNMTPSCQRQETLISKPLNSTIYNNTKQPCQGWCREFESLHSLHFFVHW